MNIKALVGAGLAFAKKHQGAILTGVSMCAYGYSLYRAIKDSPKILEKLDELNEQEATTMEKAKAILPEVAGIAVPFAAGATAQILCTKKLSDTVYSGISRNSHIIADITKAHSASRNLRLDISIAIRKIKTYISVPVQYTRYHAVCNILHMHGLRKFHLLKHHRIYIAVCKTKQKLLKRPVITKLIHISFKGFKIFFIIFREKIY